MSSIHDLKAEAKWEKVTTGPGWTVTIIIGMIMFAVGYVAGIILDKPADTAQQIVTTYVTATPPATATPGPTIITMPYFGGIYTGGAGTYGIECYNDQVSPTCAASIVVNNNDCPDIGSVVIVHNGFVFRPSEENRIYATDNAEGTWRIQDGEGYARDIYTRCQSIVSFETVFNEDAKVVIYP
jgi:hypothetical protein